VGKVSTYFLYKKSARYKPQIFQRR